MAPPDLADSRFTPFAAGDRVLLHLINPSEKFWGVLLDLGVAGVTLRGISVSSFDDWTFQAARREGTTALGLTTMFLPLFRVERMFLDEAVGEVESYGQRFQRRVGIPVEDYLGLDTAAAASRPEPEPS